MTTGTGEASIFSIIMRIEVSSPPGVSSTTMSAATTGNTRPGPTLSAEGRKKKRHEIEAVAQGRVWTGEEALAAGLVDALGGLDYYSFTVVGLMVSRFIDVAQGAYGAQVRAEQTTGTPHAIASSTGKPNPS